MAEVVVAMAEVVDFTAAASVGSMGADFTAPGQILFATQFIIAALLLGGITPLLLSAGRC